MHACVLLLQSQIKVMLVKAAGQESKHFYVDHIPLLHQLTEQCKRIGVAANWQLHPKLYIRGYGKVRQGSDDEA
jgi:hypothetical protein